MKRCERVVVASVLFGLFAAGCAGTSMALHDPDPGQKVRNGAGTPPPANATVSCDHIVFDSGLTYWVPTVEPGPVMVGTGADYHIVVCELARDVNPSDVVPIGSDAVPTRWWWDYLRGVWPTHVARRLVAGSSVSQQLTAAASVRTTDTAPATPMTVIFQVQWSPAGGDPTERCFNVGTTDVEVNFVGGSAMTAKTVAPGKYTELSVDAGNGALSLTTPTKPDAGETDPCGPYHFVEYVKKTVANKNLDKFP